MKAIAVHPNGSPWVVTDENEIYRRDGRSWQRLPGSAEAIAVGADGTAWILGERVLRGGLDILKWDDVEWRRTDGAAIRIAVGPNGQPWIVNADHRVFRLMRNDRWEPAGTRFTEIAIGSEGSVWSLGMPDNSTGDGSPILRWTGVNWQRMEGAAVRIAVDNAGLPWVINSQHVVFHLTADGEWQQLPLRATDLAAGANGKIWMLGASKTYQSTQDFRALGVRGLWWRSKLAASGETPSVMRIRGLSRSAVPRAVSSSDRLFVVDELSHEKLVHEIRTRTHFQEVTWPVLSEIEDVYARFIFRTPDSAEVARHVYALSTHNSSRTGQRQIVRRGTVRQHLDIRPLSLEIDITNQCNLRCTMCHFSLERFSKRKRVDISVGQFRQMAAQVFPLCKVVILQSATEPLLHRRFADLLSITKSYGVPSIRMATNGLLLDERRIQEIVRMVECVSISMDAATKCTYERIRRKGNFDRLISNIRALVRAKKLRGLGHPSIGMSFVMMRSNITELPAFIRLAHELEVASVTAAHLTPYAGLDLENETLDKDTELCNRSLNEAREIATRYGIELFSPPNFEAAVPRTPLLQIGTSALHKVQEADESTKPVDSSVFDPATRRDKHNHGITVWGDEHRGHCLYPWHFVVINPDGEVHPCGWWFEQSMGNIRNEPFESIWNSPRFEALRREHELGALGSNCQNCSATGMGNVNHRGAFAVRQV